MKKNRAFILLTVVLLAILGAAYSHHFDNPFQFDDDHTIGSNNWIRDWHNIPRFFKDATTTSSLPPNQAYRPGLTTLNAIDTALGGGEPDQVVFHIHIFISYLILLFLIYLLMKKLMDLADKHERNRYIALLSTAFFALHAANAETVNYIIQRAEISSSIWLLAGLLIFIYMPARRRQHLYLLPFVVGYFIKEPVAMAFGLIFLFILMFEYGEPVYGFIIKKGRKKFMMAVGWALPALVLGLGLFVFSRYKTPEHWVATYTPTLNYLFTQPYVLLHYVANFILPVNLTADTDWTPVSRLLEDRVIIGSGFIVMLAGLALWLSGKNNWRPVAFGILWFFVTLLPTSSIFPLGEVFNDHRPFLPYIGLTMAAGWAVSRCVIWLSESYAGKSWLRPLWMTAVAIILLGHAAGTYHRCAVWDSAESLWGDVVVKSPNNARGLMNYGNALMGKAKYEEARQYFTRALALWPQYSYLHVNMGILLEATGQITEAERYFNNGLTYGGNNPEAWYYYGQFLYHQGRYPEAVNILKHCLEISPEHRLARQLMPMAQDEAGKASMSALDKALARVAQTPDADAYLNLSLAYYNTGEFNKCIEAARKALDIKPDYSLAYNNICSAYNELGQYEKAREACGKALAIDPAFELARNNLKVAEDSLGKEKQL